MSKKQKGPEGTPACSRLGSVGGQAVLEGIMMRNGDSYAVGVRRETGEISIAKGEFISVRKKHKVLDLPIIRGSVNMVESMVLSFRTLETSAKQFGLEETEAEAGKLDKWLEKHFGDSLINIIMVIAMILGVGLSLGLFFFLPSLITKLMDTYIFSGNMGWWKNLAEGILKIFIFILYLLLTSLMKDIRRTFEYHGAEHKTIFCYESGEELTPANVMKYKRFHPRCGTSFLFIIIFLNILIFSLPIFTWDNVLLRFVTKLLTLPIVVGVGYEFLRFTGKHPNILTMALSYPGLLIQRITTREPDEGQIEVAIHALKAAMPEEFPDFVPQMVFDENAKSEQSKSESDGAETNNTESNGAETNNTESNGAETNNTESDGAETNNTESNGAETNNTESNGAELIKSDQNGASGTKSQEGDSSNGGDC
ncbi:MAG: DUF1385 domain-containing protein [Clostridia bacterium]|nr:DUF1385 domain-containing protein [Clostridia bacterium]